MHSSIARRVRVHQPQLGRARVDRNQLDDRARRHRRSAPGGARRPRARSPARRAPSGAASASVTKNGLPPETACRSAGSRPARCASSATASADSAAGSIRRSASRGKAPRTRRTSIRGSARLVMITQPGARARRRPSSATRSSVASSAQCRSSITSTAPPASAASIAARTRSRAPASIADSNSLAEAVRDIAQRPHRPRRDQRVAGAPQHAVDVPAGRPRPARSCRSRPPPRPARPGRTRATPRSRQRGPRARRHARADPRSGLVVLQTAPVPGAEPAVEPPAAERHRSGRGTRSRPAGRTRGPRRARAAASRRRRRSSVIAPQGMLPRPAALRLRRTLGGLPSRIAHQADEHPPPRVLTAGHRCIPFRGGGACRTEGAGGSGRAVDLAALRPPDPGRRDRGPVRDARRVARIVAARRRRGCGASAGDRAAGPGARCRGRGRARPARRAGEGLAPRTLARRRLVRGAPGGRLRGQRPHAGRVDAVPARTDPARLARRRSGRAARPAGTGAARPDARRAVRDPGRAQPGRARAARLGRPRARRRLDPGGGGRARARQRPGVRARGAAPHRRLRARRAARSRPRARAAARGAVGARARPRRPRHRR